MKTLVMWLKVVLYVVAFAAFWAAGLGVTYVIANHKQAAIVHGCAAQGLPAHTFTVIDLDGFHAHGGCVGP